MFIKKTLRGLNKQKQSKRDDQRSKSNQDTEKEFAPDKTKRVVRYLYLNKQEQTPMRRPDNQMPALVSYHLEDRL